MENVECLCLQADFILHFPFSIHSYKYQFVGVGCMATGILYFFHTHALIPAMALLARYTKRLTPTMPAPVGME